MPDRNDARAVAETTGLSGRAAEWAAFAALHAGCFTRPQVRAWVGGEFESARRTGSRIVSALRDRRLATEDEFKPFGNVVHIQGKAVYRALGDPDNRNRRKPGREKTLERLLALDYVIDHRAENWLPTERAKTEALEAAGISDAVWRSKEYESRDGTERTTRHFVEKFPLALDGPGRRAVLTCVSPGTTASRLKRWLDDCDPLIRALGTAGITARLVHVTWRTTLSDQAAEVLARAAARLGGDDADSAAIREIKAAIRAGTDEALDGVGGVGKALVTAREIYARRGEDFETTAVEVETDAWTSKRIAPGERAG